MDRRVTTLKQVISSIEMKTLRIFYGYGIVLAAATVLMMMPLLQQTLDNIRCG